MSTHFAARNVPILLSGLIREHLIQTRCFIHASNKRLCDQGSEDIEIPEKKLLFSYSLSSGPGGQNVQKVATKVEVRFHLKSADWLPLEVRERLLLRKNVNNDGFIIFTSELSRSRLANKQDVLDKLKAAIKESSETPEEIFFSVEDEELRKKLEARNKRIRVEEKRIKSIMKESRKKIWIE